MLLLCVYRCYSPLRCYVATNRIELNRIEETKQKNKQHFVLCYYELNKRIESNRIEETNMFLREQYRFE